MKNLFILTIYCAIFVITGCQNQKYGKEVDFGNLQIFYKDDVTKELATRLGEYLTKNDFLSTSADEKKSIQIIRAGDIYQLRLVVKPLMTSNDKFMNELPLFASKLSTDVFNDAKVEIDLCNQRLEPFQVVNMKVQDEWQTLASENYLIKYPSSWTVVQKRSDKIRFMLYPRSPKDAYKKNIITLGIKDLSDQPMNLKEYTKFALAELKRSGKNKLIRSSVQEGNGRDYGKMIYNDLGGEKERTEHYYWIVDDKLYVLTAEASLDNFNQNIFDTSEAIMNTFIIQ